MQLEVVLNLASHLVPEHPVLDHERLELIDSQWDYPNRFAGEHTSRRSL